MKNGKGPAAGFALLFFAIAMGAAFQGSSPIEYAEECTNGLDDDADTGADGLDDDCFNYPFKDGNGESNTPVADRYNGAGYVSLFEYHRDYTGTAEYTESAVCFAQATGMYSPQDDSAALAWIQENEVNCQGSGP